MAAAAGWIRSAREKGGWMLRGKSAQNVWSSENRNRKFGRSCPAAKRFAACTGEADTPEIRSSAGKRIRGFIRFDSIHEITLGRRGLTPMESGPINTRTGRVIHPGLPVRSGRTGPTHPKPGRPNRETGPSSSLARLPAREIPCKRASPAYPQLEILQTAGTREPVGLDH